MDIECRDVSFRYDVPGGDWALRNIDLKISQGEKLAVVGPAGSGKTTLIQLLDSLILPTTGDILYDGRSVKTLAKAKNLHGIRRRIGVLFQFPEHQFFQEMAYDELVFTMRNFLKPDEETIEIRACELMDGFNMDIDVLKTTSPFSLSSGEKRKLALASALMISPEVLILDEPTAGMDTSGRNELMRIISTLHDTTVILITHNLDDFLDHLDRVIGLSEGRIVCDVHRDAMIEHISDMENAGIVPPLVLRVQHWLRKEGIRFEKPVYSMDTLIVCLKALQEKKKEMPAR